jgi:hypothetical protein
MTLNGTHNLLAYVDNIYQLGHNMDTIKKTTGTLITASEWAGLIINVDKTTYMLMFHHYNANQNWHVK